MEVRQGEDRTQQRGTSEGRRLHFSATASYRDAPDVAQTLAQESQRVRLKREAFENQTLSLTVEFRKRVRSPLRYRCC